ncbi:MAG TPA: OsmC family protein [Gaiellaceae bacterium]|nr:OsmC family protein [Gaiellaceae bacterium]
MSAQADRPDYIVVNRAEGRMLTHSATEVAVRDHLVVSDEPPSRGGENRGPSPLEYILVGLCACVNVSTGRMAEKMRFAYSHLETSAEGVLDTRGRRGLADVPVHYQAVRLTVRIRTDEPDARLAKLQDLVGRYCPVESLLHSACQEFDVTWERLE